MEPRLKGNKIILAWTFIRQLLQPIAAFLYCNRQVAAGRRRQAKDGNCHAPAGARATERALNSTHKRSSAKIILFHFIIEPRVK